MVVILIAFMEYLVAAFVCSYVAQVATKHKHVWIFFATGLYMFSAHFVVFSYLYNIQTVSVEGIVLLMSATSLMIGSLVLYKNDDLWRHEHEAGMFIYRKKEPAENEQ